MTSLNENGTRVNRDCKYNASNTRENLNSKNVSLFGPPCRQTYLVFVRADNEHWCFWCMAGY